LPGGSLCGNGVVDSGCSEDCDPPSAQSCNDLSDGDADGLIGCLDPDCCGAAIPSCGNDCRLAEPCKRITDAPGSIKFKLPRDPSTSRPDILKVSGRVDVNPFRLNPIEDGFELVLSNSTDILYDARLLAGDLRSRSGTFGTYRWRDRSAKDGTGLRNNGLFLVRARIEQENGEWFYSFKVKAFVDLKQVAHESTMTVQVSGVNQIAIMTADWDQRGLHGWRLSKGESNSAAFPCE
jgi:hypothetical protein